ncbi:leucine-rich repeat protein [Listeria monocytogenes]
MAEELLNPEFDDSEEFEAQLSYDQVFHVQFTEETGSKSLLKVHKFESKFTTNNEFATACIEHNNINKVNCMYLGNVNSVDSIGLINATNNKYVAIYNGNCEIVYSDGQEEITKDFYTKQETDAKLATSGADGLYYEGNKLYLTRGGIIVSDAVEIVSGSGGGGATSNAELSLTNLNDSNNIANSYGSSVVLKFNFTSIENGQSTGKATCNINVNGVSRKNITINQGENEIDVSELLSSGENTVKIKCTDIYGNYRMLAYTITLIDLKITSTFDDSLSYTDQITYKYTPYGAISKTIHFVLDGNEIDTKVITTTGKQYTQYIPIMSHGTHSLEVYATAELDDATIESEKLYHEIIFVEEGNENVIIAANYNVESLQQGELVSIPFIVYNPSSLTSTIKLIVEDFETGDQLSSQTLVVDRTRQYWNTRKLPIGKVSLIIMVLDDEEYTIASKTFDLEITENDLDVEAATNDLELFLTSAGRTNSEENPAVWSYGSSNTTFENLNWKSTGWVNDENGDTCLRLNGDARATIHFKPFNSDLRVYGKTIELEFAIRDVNNRDAVVIDCKSGDIGFTVTADTAKLTSEQSSVECRYDDEQKIRVAFTIESRSEYRLLSVYLNGVLSSAKQYPTNDNFQQATPVDITIGSSYCGIDLYTIRSYSTALTPIEVNENYIADTADIVKKVELYEDNQVYDDYQNISYDKMKEKIPVVIITGRLPTSKEDEVPRVTFKYENPFNPELNFEDTCKIAVQGTSSQFYVIKNWKVSKFGEYQDAQHQHAVGQMATGVFCLKADYAEATSTHNTQNANFVESLYDELTPAQVDNELCRSTIYGFPCVLFQRDTETDNLVFVGKYNFNYDKGSENVYGFNGNYDVESWEFCNNTSDACLFKGEIPENWGDDFEARYPEGTKNIARFKVMHDWVVSTIGDVEKFKEEFEQYFDLHYCLIYYVYTFVMLMVDQRAKNMFLTYWASTGKWQPWFYDNDTCLGINNEGQLVFDYYHEDTDLLDEANVYNGQESTLWVNFRQAYASEIQEMYKSLRSSGKLTYEKLHEAFIENGSNKWPASIYNEDSEYKYISMLKSDNDASNLYQIRGTGEEHFRYFVDNRLKYCDSKWNALTYADNYVSLRIYTPSTYGSITPNADITITPYSNMYAGVKYKANGTLQQQRVAKNEEVTFEAPEETFNDTETGIYGASEISSLGDLAPLYCGSVNVSKATKLIELKIGDEASDYSNPNLKELSVGTNKMLKKIDVRNCPNLTQALALSNCPNIEEIYAQGSGITGVELADSGYLKVIKLPSTLTNLTLKNQLYIEDFSMEGNEALKTVWIENCPTINSQEIIENASSLERIRLVGVDWEFENANFLMSLSSIGGIDENGINTTNAQIIGTCHITALTGDELEELRTKYPYLTITYTGLWTDIIYMSEDGTTELYRETIVGGTNADDPIANGTIATPTKESDNYYHYQYSGWALEPNGIADENALKNVMATRVVYVAFAKETRYYNVNFYNGDVLLQTIQTTYGSSVEYTGSTPTHPTNPDEWGFKGWSPEPTNVTTNLDCYAQFKSLLSPTEITIEAADTTTIPFLYIYGANKDVTIDWGDGNTETYTLTGWNNKLAKSSPYSSIGEYVIKIIMPISCNFGNTSTSTTQSNISNWFKVVVLSENINEILPSTFANCTLLESVTIPDSVTKIGDSAFNRCSSLKNITIGNSVTSIGGWAICNCSSLTSITIPASVIQIGNWGVTIGSTTNKATIIMLGEVPPTLTLNLCETDKINQIIVPADCGNTYKSATNWSKYADIIVEATE